MVRASVAIAHGLTGFYSEPMQPVDADRWRRIQPILDRVLDLDPEARSTWLDVACADDPTLRRQVDRLLHEDSSTGGVLDTGPDAFLQLAGDDPDRDAETSGGRFIPGVILAGRYRVVSLLGYGGMGEVYRAEDLKLGQSVALKFLSSRLAGNAALIRLLLREARIARQVSHPNVCRVYDVTEGEGHTFLTMEYIDGEDLRSLLRRIGRLPQPKALDIAHQICAGLQAAHELGVLHRDLKPANVMLDARGRARITDFGIAAAASERHGATVAAGTPAYMAPEQLDGHPATARSDIYALGLVLYELFTGTRAFDGTNLEHLRRLQEDSSPTKPSTFVHDLDRRIERAILACLESDAELRPRTPRAVSALLPGGDPIDAAAEAGETPSPDLVAASGPDGSLSPSRAWGTVAATFAMLGVLLTFVDRASVLGWVAFPRSPDALEDHARGILERLGHTTAALDRARSLSAGNDRYRRYVRAVDASPQRWRVLRQPGQWDALFWYRQAPYVLMPWNLDGKVSSEDPAPQAGDAQVVTDLRGRLIWLLVSPNDADPPMGSAPPAPDWVALFREAGLDLATFHATEPTRNPGVATDTRAAWSGTADEAGGYPVRVEAAAHRGKPVYFEQVVPWDPYWNPSRSEGRSSPLNRRTTIMFRTMATLWLIVMPVAATALVVRNWLNGRGDRVGAFRLAIIVLGLRFTTWAFGAHHVPTLREEWVLLTIGLGKALVDAAACWLLYLAVEPHARRLHPRFLVSWTRLLRGRVQDPLVGRDILYGIALSTVVVLCWAQLPVIVPHALGHQSPPPPVFYPLGNLPYLYVLNPPPPEPLLGGRHTVAAVSAVALATLGLGLTFLVVLLALRVLLRRLWPALVIYAALMVAVNPFAEAAGYSSISIVGSAITTLAFVCTLRFGLVGAFAQWFGILLWMDFPVTAKTDAPHFSSGLLAPAIITAVAAYAAAIASRRRPSALTIHGAPADPARTPEHRLEESAL
jgi:serine/threonine-protein kinase